MKGSEPTITRRKKISFLYLLFFVIACCIYSKFSDNHFFAHSNQIPTNEKIFLGKTDYALAKVFIDVTNTNHFKTELYSSNLKELQNLLDESDNAINFVEASCELKFEQPKILHEHARILIAQQRYEDAEAHLVRASAKSTGIGEAEHLLMQVYHHSRKWDQLQKLANEIVTSTNDFPEAKEYLEIAKNKAGYLMVLEEETKKHPTFENFLYLSKEFFLENQFAHAYHYAQKALTLQPKLPDAHAQLGLVYHKLGNAPKAQKALETALILDTDRQLFRKNWFSIQNLVKSRIAFHKHKKFNKFIAFKIF